MSEVPQQIEPSALSQYRLARIMLDNFMDYDPYYNYNQFGMYSSVLKPKNLHYKIAQ
jgi:hypothetical protein